MQIGSGKRFQLIVKVKLFNNDHLMKKSDKCRWRIVLTLKVSISVSFNWALLETEGNLEILQKYNCEQKKHFAK